MEKTSFFKTHTIKLSTLFFFSLFLLFSFTVDAQNSKKDKKAKFESQNIFPYQTKHVHGSSIIELPNGDLLSCWFEGSGERSANDVMVKGARLKKSSSAWSKTFVMADSPGHPDCNPVLFINDKNKLFLFWIVVQANRWETSILKYRTSVDYKKAGAPNWNWQDVILLKPGEEFAKTTEEKFKESDMPDLSWSEYAPKYENMILDAAKDPKKRETGWMTRIHPITLKNGRILLPLYSDGYNFSLIAISDDDGETWTPSLPIVGRGNVQPAIIQNEDGTLIAYMRDNGDEPGRIMTSTSNDNGFEWTAAKKSSIPNPGTSVDAIKLTSGNYLMVYNDTENGRHSLAVSIS
ncbi:MAG: exo-alpha-sialidase, partial [Bacteroidota bacterium]